MHPSFLEILHQCTFNSAFIIKKVQKIEKRCGLKEEKGKIWVKLHRKHVLLMKRFWFGNIFLFVCFFPIRWFVYFPVSENTTWTKTWRVWQDYPEAEWEPQCSSSHYLCQWGWHQVSTAESWVLSSNIMVIQTYVNYCFLHLINTKWNKFKWGTVLKEIPSCRKSRHMLNTGDCIRMCVVDLLIILPF